MAAKKRARKQPEPQKQPEKKYYRILFHKDPEELAQEVNRHWDKGWHPAGGLAWSNEGYFQAICKK